MPVSEHQAGSLVDPSQLRELPVTARGVRTRSSLVAAARRVFERDGFIHSRLTDITAEAKCSIGTFYTYFDTKEEVFAAVMAEAQHEMMHPELPRVGGQDLPTQIAVAHRAYFEAYQRNAKLMLLLEQVATVNPDFRMLRMKRSRAFVERTSRQIKGFQDAGLADASLDPLMTARALTSMMSRLAYYAFALGEEMELDDMVHTTTTLWLSTLGLSVEE